MFPSPNNPFNTTPVHRGNGYAIAGQSGIIAAALAQDSIILAILCGLQASVGVRDQLSLYFERISLAITTLTAFTVPVTAARRLGIYRAAGVAATGGAALGVVKKDTLNTDSTVVGDARIATTAALTVAGIVREANPIAMLDLSHVGTSGAREKFLYELAAPLNFEQGINPGELLVVSNPVAMDAAGTFQLTAELHHIEAKRIAK